jgi:hypothetical protein
MKTMKAAVVKAFGEPLVIEQVPIPEVGAGQLLPPVFVTRIYTLRRATGRLNRSHRLFLVMKGLGMWLP